MSSLPPLPAWAAAYRRLDTVDSTNRWSIDFAAAHPASACLPMIVVADRQTAGRGRGGRAWYSDDGVLTFSILFDSSGWPRPLSQIALVVGIAVAGAVQSQLDDPLRATVKWPNDVYVQQQKIAGILVESAPADQQRLVVGIGVNVSTQFDHAENDVQRRAASLAQLCGDAPTRMEVLDAILAHLGPAIDAWKQDPAWLAAKFPHYCLLTGRSVVLRQAKTLLRGTVTGIEPDGRLRIERPPAAGGCVAVESGEVVEFS